MNIHTMSMNIHPEVFDPSGLLNGKTQKRETVLEGLQSKKKKKKARGCG